MLKSPVEGRMQDSIGHILQDVEDPSHKYAIRKIHEELAVDISERIPSNYSLEIHANGNRSGPVLRYIIKDENGKLSGEITLSYRNELLNVSVNTNQPRLSDMVGLYSDESMDRKIDQHLAERTEYVQRMMELEAKMPDLCQTDLPGPVKDKLTELGQKHPVTCHALLSDKAGVAELLREGVRPEEVIIAQKRLDKIIGTEYHALANTVYMQLM